MNTKLYKLAFGMCSFCGQIDVVVASDAVDEDAPVCAKRMSERWVNMREL